MAGLQVLRPPLRVNPLSGPIEATMLRKQLSCVLMLAGASLLHDASLLAAERQHIRTTTSTDFSSPSVNHSDSESVSLLRLLVKKGVISEEDLRQLELEQMGETDHVEYPHVGYDKGAFIRTQGGDHELHFHFLMQPGFETVDRHDAPTESSFLIRHAQLRLFGHILDPRLKYRMMVDGTAKSRSDDVELRDLWVDWQWTDYLQIKFGQFLVWFDYENISPTWALHLVDRSIINAEFGFERDRGIQVHGHLHDDRIQYYLFVMNGEGRNALNAGNDLIYAARLDLHLLGTQQYLIADVKTSYEPQMAWGTGYLHDTANPRANGDRLNRITTDLTFRYMGWSALCLLNVIQNQDRQRSDVGYLGQLGWFVFPEQLELVGRFADISRDGAVDTALADPREATVGVNYYFDAHQVKLQVDYSRLWNDKSAANRDAHRARVQLQLFF